MVHAPPHPARHADRHLQQARRRGRGGRDFHRGTGAHDKTIIAGIKQRDGELRASVAPDTTRRTLQGHVAAHVAPGSSVYTDAHRSYTGLERTYAHKTVDHAEKYVDGRAHTNGLENFWSLLKRGLNGTYVSVQPFHLFRYLFVLRAAAGRRLTWAELTGQA